MKLLVPQNRLLNRTDFMEHIQHSWFAILNVNFIPNLHAIKLSNNPKRPQFKLDLLEIAFCIFELEKITSNRIVYLHTS